MLSHASDVDFSKQGRGLAGDNIGVALRPEKKVDYGGIDLTRKRLPLQTQGDGVNFNLSFDPQNFESIPFKGLKPDISTITPLLVEDLPLILGLAEDHLKQLSAIR